jgi:very-short-patch-repair endonuclease
LLPEGILSTPDNEGLTAPLDILVANESARKANRLVRNHICCGPYPKSCFFDTGQGLLTCSPELCFLQMAENLPLLKLIELGFEFCGTYSLAADGIKEATLQLGKPLTSKAKLQALVAKMNGRRGKKNATRALKYVVDGSASPMETMLAMLLSLPQNLGGYGLAKPLLNQRIDVVKTAKRASRKDHYVCDLYWQEVKLDVEYDSDLFHTGSSRISDDSKRRNALTYLGIQVITITRQQLYTSGEFDKAVRLIAKRLGKRLHYSNPKFAKKHQELRALLPNTTSM